MSNRIAGELVTWHVRSMPEWCRRILESWDFCARYHIGLSYDGDTAVIIVNHDTPKYYVDTDGDWRRLMAYVREHGVVVNGRPGPAPAEPTLVIVRG